MERVIERGCGLDVHKKSVVASVRVPGRITLEAAIPVNDHSGTAIAGRASLDFFLRRLFPKSRLFHPLF